MSPQDPCDVTQLFYNLKFNDNAFRLTLFNTMSQVQIGERLRGWNQASMFGLLGAHLTWHGVQVEDVGHPDLVMAPPLALLAPSAVACWCIEQVLH